MTRDIRHLPAGHVLRLVGLLALAVLALSTTVLAQTAGGTTVGGSVSAASLWDDETHLGRGPAIATEASTPLGDWVRVGVEAGWFGHNRDSGYLAADGHVLQLMGRGSLLVGPRHWRARPFLGAGLGLARSTGTLTTLAPFVTPAETSRSWGLTRLAWELHTGVRVAAGDRWALRPELRVGAVGGSDRTAVIQTPLLRAQAGVAVEWAPR